jgi:CubicO group peptidase (beta-lactamase class C family)
MAFRNFDPANVTEAALSRRALMRGGAYAAASSALAGLPFGQMLAAHDVSQAWPHLAALYEKFVGGGKVANMIITLGKGQEDHAHTVGGGKLGFASSQDVDADSLFRIYSMTKPITGMAIMMLIDEGKIGLDQPLAEIIPAFAKPRVLVEEDGPLDNTVAADRPITIRQMLTHTSGIGYIINAKGPLRKAYAENGLVGGRVSRLPIPGLPEVTPAPNLEVWTERLASLPLIAQPGTKWHYSASIDLLGRVVEIASGMEFEAFLKERFFDPLGMESTFFTLPKDQIGRMTDNYGILNGTPLPIDPAKNSIYLDKPTIASGGGGLISSARDYDRFQRMLLGHGKFDGKRVMGELAVRVGTSNIMPKTASTKGTWVEGQGMGAGGRSVGSSFGWGGAAGTLASIDYGLNMRIALFTQYMPTESYPIRKEFLEAIAKDTAHLKGQ